MPVDHMLTLESTVRDKLTVIQVASDQIAGNSFGVAAFENTHKINQAVAAIEHTINGFVSAYS